MGGLHQKELAVQRFSCRHVASLVALGGQLHRVVQRLPGL
jgi:hypothetical protein